MPFAALRIGSLTAPRVALGTWALGGGNDWGDTSERAAQDTLQAALDRGVLLFDTAPIYGAGLSEERVGRAIAGRRSQILLATKCGIVLRDGRPDHDLHPQSIVAECENSLRRLHTDYIDLYQIHWPDPKVPLCEAVGVLSRLQEQGKIRAIGLCNVSQAQLQEACQVATIASVQGVYSLLNDSHHALAGFCEERGISFWAYGALGGGILSGKYAKEPNLRRCDARRYFYKYYFGEDFNRAANVTARVQQVAQAKHQPPSAVALAWVLHQKGVSGVLAGARNPVQVAENIAAEHLSLSAAEQDFLYGNSSAN